MKNQFSLTKLIIESNLKHSHGLTTTEKSVLVTLSSYFGKKDGSTLFQCYPSQERIAAQVGCTRPTVSNTLQKLERLGFISSCHRHSHTSKLYTWLGIPTIEEKEIDETSVELESHDSEIEEITGNSEVLEIERTERPLMVVSHTNISPTSSSSSYNWVDDLDALIAEERPF